ncbi:DUF695 domain-containing protein [Alysiella filiformis]|uniref:DUF695 domain-containing protein n=1 Tax=Alysiella filiformis DSM 16848 TaxID=1120981 RepID=A0A286EE54_9NEIS|nr:DUF695 domain-containing protein [Alysiella filiformis]QMT30944.1 DUF695 domain-containing protein [Alysiella filiformis]UBQ56068.1 DUF695 domain-containing protein [Alysiella filiformis DSM 16848]SOD69187.1 Family of unknown function [Alysiella filiformis DSM 16848]
MLQQLYQTQHAAKQFWQAFQNDFAQLKTLSGQEFVEQGNELLRQFLPEMTLEFVGNWDSGATLVFTAQGITEYFHQVQILVDTQPQNLPFAVQAFRHALPNVERFEIGIGDWRLNVSDILFHIDEWQEMPALEIAFTQDFTEEQLSHAQNMTFIMLDHILGEYNSAAKIGAVDFVETADDDFEPLFRLPEALSALWAELGRTGVYPQEEWQYGVAQIEEDEEHEQDALVLTRNQSANSLLGRADMAWVVSVSCQLRNGDDVETAYDLQDQFNAYANLNQQGIETLSVMNLSQGVRTVFAATSAPEILFAQAEKLCQQFADLNAQTHCEYDPNWAHYRQ